ncbi:Uncharacterised protein [Mycobacteroides abscessus subsp. massiliense]|nr:Uncharacterised protein [Mycobacteroides abscessus subsp. massiliense]
MLVVLVTDLGEVLGGGAVLLHVLTTGGAEHPGRRREGEIEQPGEGFDVPLHGLLAIGEGRAQRSGLHLLESQRQRDISESTANGLRRIEQRGRAG